MSRSLVRRGRAGRRAAGLIVVAVALSCAPPRARPLAGVPTPVRLPRAELPPAPTHLMFRWRYRDPSISIGGDGAARVAPPDSARLDFVVSGPLGGGGFALLFGDTLVAPGAGSPGGGGGGGGGARRYLPAIPMLWATLGRLAVPEAADTIVRLDGDTLRGDIGPTPDGTTWRVAFTGGQLMSLARLSGGRVRESVVRDLGRGRVQYQNADARRSLVLTRVRSETVSGFDAQIWRP